MFWTVGGKQHVITLQKLLCLAVHKCLIKCLTLNLFWWLKSDQKTQIIITSAKQNPPSRTFQPESTNLTYSLDKQRQIRERQPPNKLVCLCHVESSSPQTVSSSFALSCRLFIDCSKDGSDQASGVCSFIRGRKMKNPKCQYVSGVSVCLLGSTPLGANRQRLCDENVMMWKSSRFLSKELKYRLKNIPEREASVSV